jgi:hypothetical protein
MESIMIARVARWDPFPDVPWVTEVGAGVPGVLAVYHVIDEHDRSGLSISFAEDDTDFDVVTAAILAENSRRGADGFSGAPTDVTQYRVHAFAPSGTTIRHQA